MIKIYGIRLLDITEHEMMEFQEEDLSMVAEISESMMLGGDDMDDEELEYHTKATLDIIQRYGWHRPGPSMVQLQKTIEELEAQIVAMSYDLRD